MSDKRHYTLYSLRNGQIKPFSGEQIMSMAWAVSQLEIRHERERMAENLWQVVHLHNASFSYFQWMGLCNDGHPGPYGHGLGPASLDAGMNEWGGY